MAPQSADIERTERLRYNLGDARPPIPRRESLSTVYAYVKQHRHFEAAGIPIIPIAPVSPSPRPRKRPRPNAPIPPLPLPPAADPDPSPMSSQDDYPATPPAPPAPPHLDSAYGMSPSFPQPQLPLLLPAPAKTVPTSPQPATDQPNHHNHFPVVPVFTSILPTTSYSFSSPPLIPAEPFEFVDAFNELYAPPAAPPTDWRMTPDSFEALYRGLDAPIANIDRILERNRERLEGGTPAAPKADMWASYPPAVDPFQRNAIRSGLSQILERNREHLEGGTPAAPKADMWVSYPPAVDPFQRNEIRSGLVANGRAAIRGGRRRRMDGDRAFA